ncbi:MAG TPA: rhomboid family intramembrane serine protease [Cyclobacteriaceae bacterium]|nr:rhomboid family intramembrane serine protease [Cyclobacteriaceae bacterium]
MVFIMWLVFTVEVYLQTDFNFLGIAPRRLFGLIGILTAPLIHGDLYHLISNTIPLLFLGATLYFFYERIAGIVFFRSYFWTNILVWLFAREALHIGASGLVYGLASFLIFLGWFRRDFISLFISIIITLAYGGVFYGILPQDPRVSWEAHLAGAMVGVFSAYQLSKIRKLY